MGRAPAAAGLALLVAAGGAAPVSAQAGVTRRDSLGITIFESARLGPRVVATPRLRLGAVDGSADVTFFQVRDARLGPHGTLYVLDEGDDIVKVFDRSGTLLRSLGGAGEGPSEFSAPWLLEVRGDTLRVLDRDLRKIVAFGNNGDLLATRRIGFSVAEHGFPEAFASRADGGLFIAGVQGCGFPRRPTDNLWGLFGFGPDGGVQDTLSREFIRNALPSYSEGRYRSCTVQPWPFAPGPTLAFDPSGGGYRSPGDAFEIHRVDPSLTRVTAIMRYPVSPRRVTGAQRRAFQDQLDARDWGNNRDLQRAVQQAVDSAGYPDVWPAITALRVAGPGTVWAQRAHPIGAPEQEWDVLVDGRHVRTVVLPGGLAVLDVRDDLIVGRLEDELDVQYVAVFGVPR